MTAAGTTAGGRAASGDVVPLSVRVTLLSALRAVLAVLLVPVALAADRLTSPAQLVLPLTYVLGAALAGGALILVRWRSVVVAGFGLLLCLDGVAVQVVRHGLGPTWGADLVLATFLTAACLLASFRTGVKLAIWQSLLILVDDRGTASGLFPAGAPQQHGLAVQLVLIWILTLATCVAASVNERELRRRRYDAEALQAFAAALHRDEAASAVVARTVGFVARELDAGRVLACQWSEGELSALHAVGPVVADRPAGREPSPLLALADRAGYTVRVLTLDPRLDPWLAGALPGARRVVVLPLSVGGTTRTWIVFEHRGRGIRVTRRVLATAGQASATAALAMSRAVLFEAVRRSATTDGLTGLANRPRFDSTLAAMAAAGRGGLVLVDVDHFKAVNDTYGHQTGDQVLQAVAAVLVAAAPQGATVARYGGEEFAVLLPRERGAEVLAEKLRQVVEAAPGPVPVTASFGVAELTPGITPAQLVAAADGALYRAKQEGRNQVRAGYPTPVPGPRAPAAGGRPTPVGHWPHAEQRQARPRSAHGAGGAGRPAGGADRPDRG
ncbi:diguanylate cyclase domain-containing protein [Spongisporangium articulatum]|uniref:Diguanylate cyclase domain-containing protein n=1 Tax=Spongisporangium articulatum TaxID=3362603 RepID=A0ABW8AM67_9ACTN